jgi:hypothetical protein
MSQAALWKRKAVPSVEKAVAVAGESASASEVDELVDPVLLLEGCKVLGDLNAQIGDG